jgi:hypothetical protein
VTGPPVDPTRTGDATLLAEALDRIRMLPPGRRALVDQHTAILRARLTRAGLLVTPLTVAGFLAGFTELDYQAARTSGVRAAAVSLRHAAAQLLLPGVCPGCVADLDRALAASDATSPRLREAPGHRPRAGGAR